MVEAFIHRACTPEQIAEDFRLSPGDVYSVIGYCLRHRDEVNAYLEELHYHNGQWRLEMGTRGRSPTDWQKRLRERAESKARV